MPAQCAYDGHMDKPTPQEIIDARTAAGQSTAEAATLVYVALRTWQQWEAGDRKMPRASWELYLIHTGQHPEKKLAKKPQNHLRKRWISAYEDPSQHDRPRRGGADEG